jgi:uncharacterized protein YjcR
LARSRSPNRDKAFDIFKSHSGDITNREIAGILQEDEKVIAVWKSRDKWANKCNVVQHSKQSCTTKEKGGQPGNKNATGPPGNKNAERYGFFAKWLPEETQQIMGAIQSADPLDLLWDNIQLQYTAIIRAQKLMYVKNQQDKTTEKVMEGTGSIDSEKWEVQQAWDKHATFLQAQSRAMKTLESMIKQYDELLHKNWDMATEEQRTRIAVLKAKANLEDNGQTEDDGFLDALQGKVDEVWQDE